MKNSLFATDSDFYARILDEHLIYFVWCPSCKQPPSLCQCPLKDGVQMLYAIETKIHSKKWRARWLQLN